MRRLAVSGLLAALATAALADAPIGHVVQLSGAVSAGPSSIDRRPVAAGSGINTGDRLIVEPGGSAEIEFRDGIRLTLGPGTDLRIRAYGAAPSQLGIVDLFDGAIRAEAPDVPGRRLDVQTNTAVIASRAAAWTVIAEAETTAILVHRGTIRVQQLDIGRGPRGPVRQVAASHGVTVPAVGPATVPREFSKPERDALDRRLRPSS